MAFDGITIANIVKELQEKLIGGRVYKIAQPEPDELLLTIKTANGQKRLLLSASASLPLLYLTQENKPSPMTAPNFCMLLRKHLQNGRITGIVQPGLERIVHMEIEHLDEMGDLCKKKLIIEIMGKHSNLIFCDAQDVILDSIKRVSGLLSSVREVLPGKPYFIADTTHKEDPLTVKKEAFIQTLSASPLPLFKALYASFTGFSPVVAEELCYRARLESSHPASSFDRRSLEELYKAFAQLMDRVREGNFSPCIVYEQQKPVEFAAFPLQMYGEKNLQSFESISALLESYYAEKNALTRMRQKSADLRKIVQTALERNVKKYDLQRKQMQDTEKRDTYRLYGELLNAYGYSLKGGERSLEALNYYTNEKTVIPLDETLSASQNAQKYFEKYGKQKRTYEALSALTQEVQGEIAQLRSIETALKLATDEEDLLQIKEELIQSGYIRRKGGEKDGKKQKLTGRPLHYISSDGYDIYVGKNNLQNDELTFRSASGGDWWFHAKAHPGSHVIVKCMGKEEPPDTTFEEAARLAAYYSSGREQEKVEVDYVQRKHVKKPGGARPGFVVYYTNYSMAIDTDISGIRHALTN